MPSRLQSIAQATRAAAVLLLLAAAVPAGAASQQVRIVADGTEVRLDPSDSSPVITTMTSGTLLDWVGESGAWYAVSVAGPPGEDDVVGYVLASEVELVGTALPPANEPMVVPPSLTGVPDPEQQYRAQRRRRASGVRKVIWGLAMIGTGYAALEFVPPLQVPVPEDFDDADSYQSALDRRSTAETARTIVTGLGGVLGAWGVSQIVLGWRNMRSLELELPRQAPASLQEQYNDAFRMRSSGRRKVIWAVLLPLVAYGTVEFIPYFGAPKVEDFDNSEDFQAAETRRDRAETARSWTYAFGAGLGGWGATQWVLGARRMSQIDATARMSALSIPLRPSVAGVPVELFANPRGARTEFGIGWRW